METLISLAGAALSTRGAYDLSWLTLPAGKPDLLGRRRRATLGHRPGRVGPRDLLLA